MDDRNSTPKILSLDQTRYDDNYMEKYDKIQDVIEDLNSRLLDMFHRKYDKLVQEYKDEMFKAQNYLNELRDNTNEEELKRKMIEKKEQLQKYRYQFLQASIFFSNKCENFKQKLSTVVSETKDIESEIKFLTEQINIANQKNIELKEELEKVQTAESTVTIDRNLEKSTKKEYFKRYMDLIRIPMTATVKRNMSYQNQTATIQTSRTEIQQIKEKSMKLREILKNPIYQENDLEKIFIYSVNRVKYRKVLKKKESKYRTLPLLKKSSTQPVIDYPLKIKITDGYLNDFDKRSIMEEFLSKYEVKTYLYKLIFKYAIEAKKVKKPNEDN